MHGYLICGHIGEEHSSSRRSLLPTFLRFAHAACQPVVKKCVARPQKQKQKGETNGMDVGGIKRHNTRTAPR